MQCSPLKGVVLGLILVFVGNLSAKAQSSPSKKDVAAANSSPQSEATPGTNARDENFIIGNDDVLAISVWKEPELTKSVPVRSDGKISLPLVGEMQAAGRTPPQLERDITEKLKNFITTPEVTVIVEKVNSRKFNMLGQVNKAGEFPLTASTTIMDAIAMGGGFKDFAKKSGVYILRKGPDGRESRINFNYKDFIKGKNPDQNIKLEPNDTIIVP